MYPSPCVSVSGVLIWMVGSSLWERRGVNVAVPWRSPCKSFGFSLLRVRRSVQRVGEAEGEREREEKIVERRFRGGIVGSSDGGIEVVMVGIVVLLGALR